MIDFFDCNCSFGKWLGPVFKVSNTAKELVEEMDFCGIKRALVHHTEMRFHAPFDGNKTLFKEISDFPNLIPTRAILPYQTGEQPEDSKLLKEMKSQGIKALIAFPSEHQFLLDKETFGELLTVLSERRIPLFIRDNLIQIRNVLRSFPKLTIIAISQGPHNLDRYFRPLIENYPNFYIDISSYVSENGIESFCEKYGPGRMIFGTGYPANYMGSAMLRLSQADIPVEYKKAIASENLEKILAEVIL